MSSMQTGCQVLGGDVSVPFYQKHMTQEVCVWEKQGEAEGKEGSENAVWDDALELGSLVKLNILC